MLRELCEIEDPSAEIIGQGIVRLSHLGGKQGPQTAIVVES